MLGELWALAVDWRYTLPNVILNDPAAVRALYRNTPIDRLDNAGTVTHPSLYVAGRGGVFRTLDDGNTWTTFGDGMPVTEVRDLNMALGKVDPANGRAVAAPGDPNLLAAFTYGRGAFGIRLAPVVLPDISPGPGPDQPGVRAAAATAATTTARPQPPSASATRVTADNQPVHRRLQPAERLRQHRPHHPV